MHSSTFVYPDTHRYAYINDHEPIACIKASVFVYLCISVRMSMYKCILSYLGIQIVKYIK
jgi:hypothetical protein